ncbi:uncharacterized protein LOC108101543 [Drosophila ficusphila]|uniref:uncharacterized protein LOC108101543 n=1 Tax=Drosophila ficusphila TaxID=30025 RepID=UPI0007E7C4A0|nr:uncharacterized protein LOC108101543 [Drosophila ficusphila]
MEERGVLSLVKKVIHSLVVSSPGQMTIEKLMRDYRSEEGCNVPYQNLGFRDAESFLRSIPDTVQVMGHGPMALVRAVATAKSAHIQKLVQCQKKPNNRSRSRGHHKPKYCFASERSNLTFINESVRKMSSTQVTSRTYQAPKNQHIPVSYPNYNRLMYPAHPSVAYPDINAMICAGQRQNASIPQWRNVAIPQMQNFSRTQSQNILRPQTQNNSTPQSQNNRPLEQNRPQINPLLQEKNFPETERLKVENSLPKSLTNKNVHPQRPQTPEKLKQANAKLDKETKEIVDSFQNLTVEETLTVDQDKLQNKLDESEVKEVVKDLFSSGDEDQEHRPEVATIVKEGNSSEELDLVSQHNYKSLSYSTTPEVIDLEGPEEPFFDNESSDDGDDENAFPAFAVDERVLGVDYPLDSVRFDYKLPGRDIETIIKLEQRIEVQLVKVDNPHHFNFWVYNEEFNEYKALTSNMQTFYESRNGDKYTMPLSLITEDHLCAVRSSNSGAWERAQVVKHRPDNFRKTIEVELIDTGVQMCVTPRDIKFLLKEFATLPPQWLAGRLAFITQWKAPSWSAEAVNFFYKMVSYRILCAKVEAIENNTAYLVLVDPNTDEQVKNLNKSLIDSGWARRCITA